MARIFAPASLKASRIPASFYRFLEGLGNDCLVLLEFHVVDGDGRQADAAILSPRGVDLIEVKDKLGRVVGRANGTWTVTGPDGTPVPFSNKKAGVQENPYDQALKTAQDLGAFLARETGYRRLGVYPLVLVPSANPLSTFEKRADVHLANGVDELNTPGTLRAQNPKYPKSSAWAPEAMDSVPRLLGLTEVGLSILYGRVVAADSGEPVPGAQVTLSGGTDEPVRVTTDLSGKFEALLRVGWAQLNLEAAGWEAPGPVDVDVVQGIQDLGNIRLARYVEPLRARTGGSGIRPRPWVLLGVVAVIALGLVVWRVLPTGAGTAASPGATEQAGTPPAPAEVATPPAVGSNLPGQDV
ncbi:MAG TPA: carboxypeptidase regulatory-like domain-containing protein, partial [Deinococcales bacterium]|nr:carboxypeptidase regulatory-like domain-containing protein [Deinococcales bacterium]